MRPSGAETRQRVIEAAYDLFYRDGFHRVGVDAVAEAAGVTKRTLYYHFDSKDALLAAVLEHQGGLAVGRIEAWLGPVSEAPAAVTDALFDALDRWAVRPGWAGSGFTRLTMELAGLPGHPARDVARRHKAAIEELLAQRLSDRHGAAAPGLARRIMLLLEGCQAMILISGDRAYAQEAAVAARALVEQSAVR